MSSGKKSEAGNVVMMWFTGAGWCGIVVREGVPYDPKSWGRGCEWMAVASVWEGGPWCYD